MQIRFTQEFITASIAGRNFFIKIGGAMINSLIGRLHLIHLRKFAAVVTALSTGGCLARLFFVNRIQTPIEITLRYKNNYLILMLQKRHHKAGAKENLYKERLPQSNSFTPYYVAVSRSSLR